VEWIVGFFAYMGVGILVANRFYFPRRHGVRSRLGAGLAGLDAGFLGAIAVAYTWPIAVWLPMVRDPEPCRHEHHVLARARRLVSVSHA
jgi:hypothetical protein